MRHTFSFPLCLLYNAVICVSSVATARNIYSSSNNHSVLEWEVNICQVCFGQVRIANFVSDGSFDGVFVNL